MRTPKIILDCFTGADNSTYDIGRIGFGGAHLMLYWMVITAWWSNHPYGLMDFASAESTITVAYAIHLQLKKVPNANVEDSKKEE
jgi:hypothetical protein